MDGNTVAADNKRIAKNTVALYVRTAYTMVVKLFAVKYLLQALGEDDYGLYGLVAGAVLIFDFLNLSMNAAAQRFFSYELGRGDKKKLRELFSASLTTHCMLAIVVVVLAELASLCLLDGFLFPGLKLNIPAERMVAARWVYHLSVLAAMMPIFQVPFSAMIVAHERMDIFTVVEISKSTLLFAIAIVVMYVGADRLVSYAVFYLVVVALILAFYVFMCRKRCPEARFYKKFDRHLLPPFLLFSGWELLGNGSMSLRQYGINVMVNLFFKLAYNATSAIATQVNFAVVSFANTVVFAFRPQIIKRYAMGDFKRMQQLMNNASKFSVLLMALLVTPLVIEMPLVLEKWLGQDKVPPEGVEFCRYLVLASMVGIVNSVVLCGVHATGKIKWLNILNGSVLLASLPVVYVLYRMGYPAYTAYSILVFVNIGVLSTSLAIMHHYLPELSIRKFLFETMKSFMWVAVAAAVTLLVRYCVNPYCSHLSPVLKVIVEVGVPTLVNAMVILSLTYCFVIDEEMRDIIKQKLMRKANEGQKSEKK